MRDLTPIFKANDIRGIVPKEWGHDEARAIGAAFADLLAADEPGAAPTMLVGRDMRTTGPEMSRAFIDGARTRGANVKEIGLISTDGLYFCSGAYRLPGATFTASHNPFDYNGVKFCRALAKPIGKPNGLDSIRKDAEKYLSMGTVPPAASHGSHEVIDSLPDYAAYLRSLVDLSGIRRLKVVIDAGNGMGGMTAPSVLGDKAGLPALPLDIVPLYFELDGSFPNHPANPLDPANLVDLQKKVVAEHADLGLAFDGDADRCFIVDEKGHVVNPSAILCVVGQREIARDKAAGNPRPAVVHNLIVSHIVSETLAAAGGEPIRSKVGHAFIKTLMAEHNGIFGGEHSGHFYFRDFYFADTGMLTAMHVMAALAQSGHTLSQLTDMYEPYFASGEINSRLDDVDAARQRVYEAFVTQKAEGPVDCDELDGLFISHWDATPRWWLSVRMSNTEPLLRLNVEAQDEDVMEKIRDAALALIRQGA